MKKLSLETFLSLALVLVFPLISQAVDTPTTFSGFVLIIIGLIGLLVPVVASLSLLVFLWGLAKFILAAGNEDAIADGKNIMIWGLIALFVMASVWGIVSFLSSTFGFGLMIGVPQLPA